MPPLSIWYRNFVQNKFCVLYWYFTVLTRILLYLGPKFDASILINLNFLISDAWPDTKYYDNTLLNICYTQIYMYEWVFTIEVAECLFLGNIASFTTGQYYMPKTIILFYASWKHFGEADSLFVCLIVILICIKSLLLARTGLLRF